MSLRKAISKELALIAQSADVSEGFLPLTAEDIADTAFKSLGQMYGWGGMLEANDCSGYVRDVYKCFGLELARNTTCQANLPVRKYSLKGLSDARKAAAIAQMPLGTVLIWSAHEVMYLGQEGGKLYVISAVGGIGNVYGDSGGSYQVKGVTVNTLDMVRGDRSTWLSNLTDAIVPYIPESDQGTGFDDIEFYEDSVTWPDESYVYTGEPIKPEVTIPWLNAEEDYKVSFEDNTEIGTATVTVTGQDPYTGTISRTFKIVSDSGKTAIDEATIRVQDQVYTGEALKPEPIVFIGATILEQGKDYEVTYENNVKVGTATLKVTGIGQFTGEVSKTFDICSTSLTKATVTVANKTYTGKALRPKPTVKTGSIVLEEGSDYTVSYIDNKAVGTALVKVTGKGNFTDTAYGTFKIGKASQTIVAKNASKKLKASSKTKKLAKDRTINLKKLAKVSAKSTVTFKKANAVGGKKITVDAATGKVTLKKGLGKKTYKVKVKLTAAASESYKAAKAKTITLKLIVA